MPIAVSFEELIEMYELLVQDMAQTPAGTTLHKAYREAAVGVFNLLGAIKDFRAVNEREE